MLSFTSTTSLQHYPQFTYSKKQNCCESGSYGRRDFLDVSSNMRAETYDKCLPPRNLHRQNSIEVTGSFRPVLLRKQAVIFLLAELFWVLWACFLFVCWLFWGFFGFFFPQAPGSIARNNKLQQSNAQIRNILHVSPPGSPTTIFLIFFY